MAGYFVFDIDIVDSAGFAEYAAAARPLLAERGGTILINSVSVDPLEGEWRPSSIVVARFPTMEDAYDFYRSEEYQKLLTLRDRSARARGILVRSE